jgi:Flp pilus assembly protein TadD
MSKKIVASLVAAFTLAACEERAAVGSTHVEPKVVAPVITSKVAAIDAGVALVDAGVSDVLALTHDTPAIDHLQRATQLEADGDAKGALVEARRALFTTPDDRETLARVAKLSRATRNHALAAEAFGRIAALDPADATSLISRGRALLVVKDFTGAVLAGRDAVARDDGNPEGWQVIGLGKLGVDELPGAIASFEKAVELAPNHGWALNNLGFAYLRANENQKAVEVLQRASVLLPTVAYVQNNYGVALERVARPDEAKAAYQHAMDLSPKYVKARVNAARIAKASLEPRAEPGVGEPDSMSDMLPAETHPVP